jgi:hypothetical protein
VTREQIDEAVTEANRFIERAQAARDALEFRPFKALVTGGFWIVTDSRATAALRRSSMDLTRSLVAIRK